jgi:hypothetical protein
MAKCSAPIQLSPFPGHGSQKLFLLFPIPTFDKEKRGWDGKQQKQFLTAMPWKGGELDRGRTFCHL